MSFLSPTFIADRSLLRYLKTVLNDVVGRDPASLGGEGGEEVWLDLGCGMRPYEPLVAGKARYVGLDVEISGRDQSLKKADLYYDGAKIPFDDQYFTGVLNTQVLEHVTDHKEHLKEVVRVLKPGGHLVLTAPFVYQEHEQPFDFYRFSTFGMRQLLSEAGLEVIALHKTTGGVETIAQLSSVWCSHNLRLPIKGFGRLVSLVLCVPINMIGLILQKVLPNSGELFLDIVVVARKPQF